MLLLSLSKNTKLGDGMEQTEELKTTVKIKMDDVWLLPQVVGK